MSYMQATTMYNLKQRSIPTCPQCEQILVPREQVCLESGGVCEFVSGATAQRVCIWCNEPEREAPEFLVGA